MKKNQLIIITILTLVSVKVYAQDATKLKWAVTALTDMKADVQVTHTSEIITHGNQYIEWLQRHGAVTQRFDIVSTTGTWADVTKPGKITYTVTQDGAKGTFMFERKVSGIEVTIDFSTENTYGIRQRLSISEVKPLLP